MKIHLNANWFKCHFFVLFLIFYFFLVFGLTANAADYSYTDKDVNHSQQDELCRPINKSPLSTGIENGSQSFKLPPPLREKTTALSDNTVVLSHIIFAGNSAISDEILLWKAKEYIGVPLTVADIEQLRACITAVYVDSGYVNSGARLIPQSSENGELLISIYEGELTEVIIETVSDKGMSKLDNTYVKDRLQAAAGSPLNVINLKEKYQALLSDPLIKQLNGTLLPGLNSGESILKVKVTEADLFDHFHLETDDYTTPSVGGYTGRIGGVTSHLSNRISRFFGRSCGLNERIDADFIVTGGALGVNTGIEVPINRYDTRASFRYSNTTSSLIEKPIDTLNIKSNIIGYEAGLSQPFYTSLNSDLNMGVIFSLRESNSTVSDQPYAFTEGLPYGNGVTKVAALRVWQQFHWWGKDRNAIVLRSTFNKGLDALGATIQNRSLPSGDYFSWTGQAQVRWETPFYNSFVVLKGSVQQSANPLLSLERFAVGGVYSVRGYRESYYVRDNGFSSGVELYLPLFGGESTAKHSLFLIPFMDYGGAWNNPTVADTNPQKNYLHSVGVGFNFQCNRKLYADFFWAHDIAGVSPPTGGKNIQDDGIHFKLRYDIL